MKKACLILVLLLFPSGASAWEQTMTCGGSAAPCGETEPLPTFWATPCIGFHLNENGTKQMNFTEVQTVVKKSVSSWMQPTKSSLHPYYSGLTNENRIGYNPYIDENANIIVFRDDDTWEESSSMMALTTVTHRNSTGEIYDADIEINTTHFKYGIYEKNGANVVDLENTLTHEIGHVFGLSHSNNLDATMFPYSSTGETNLRTLSDDDIEAISTIYPPDLHTQSACEAKEYFFEKPPYEMNEGPASSGCSVHTMNRNYASLLVIFVFYMLLCAILRRRILK